MEHNLRPWSTLTFQKNSKYSAKVLKVDFGAVIRSCIPSLIRIESCWMWKEFGKASGYRFSSQLLIPVLLALLYGVPSSSQNNRGSLFSWDPTMSLCESPFTAFAARTSSIFFCSVSCFTFFDVSSPAGSLQSIAVSLGLLLSSVGSRTARRHMPQGYFCLILQSLVTRQQRSVWLLYRWMAAIACASLQQMAYNLPT